jgi:hypothetical protein
MRWFLSFMLASIALFAACGDENNTSDLTTTPAFANATPSTGMSVSGSPEGEGTASTDGIVGTETAGVSTPGMEGTTSPEADATTGTTTTPGSDATAASTGTAGPEGTAEGNVTPHPAGTSTVEIGQGGADTGSVVSVGSFEIEALGTLDLSEAEGTNPSEGNRLVGVSMRLKNVGEEPVNLADLLIVTLLQDNGGDSHSVNLSATGVAMNQGQGQFSPVFDPGEEQIGSLGFEIPVNTEPFQLVIGEDPGFDSAADDEASETSLDFEINSVSLAIDNLQPVDGTDAFAPEEGMQFVGAAVQVSNASGETKDVSLMLMGLQLDRIS